MSLQILIVSKMLAINEIGSIKDNGINELIEKFIEPKTENLSKSQKLSKFKKLAKSKNLSKSRNLPNFNIKKAGLSFLNSDTKTTFNYL